MTNIRKAPTSSTTTSEPHADLAQSSEAAETKEPVLGPRLRAGQKAEKVTFAHHLRISGRNYRPGDTALVSPDYARQLRTNGYIARGRA